MKIAPLLELVRFTERVQEKADGRARRDSEHRNPNQQEQEQGKEAPDPQQVERAIQEFSSDPNALSNGLSVTSTGNGPGLRVVLKDRTGSVLRQFTGEEFLRLREAAAKDVLSRGQLLDRKL